MMGTLTKRAQSKSGVYRLAMLALLLVTCAACGGKTQRVVATKQVKTKAVIVNLGERDHTIIVHAVYGSQNPDAMLFMNRDGRQLGGFMAPNALFEIAGWLPASGELLVEVHRVDPNITDKEIFAGKRDGLFAISPASLAARHIKLDLAPFGGKRREFFTWTDTRCSRDGKWLGCTVRSDAFKEHEAVFMVPSTGGTPRLFLEGQKLSSLVSGCAPGTLGVVSEIWDWGSGRLPSLKEISVFLTAWPHGRARLVGMLYSGGEPKSWVRVGSCYAVTGLPGTSRGIRLEVRFTQDNSLVATFPVALHFQPEDARWIVVDKQLLLFSSKELTTVSIPKGRAATVPLQGLPKSDRYLVGPPKPPQSLLVGTAQALWRVDWKTGKARRLWKLPQQLPKRCRQLDPRTWRE